MVKYVKDFEFPSSGAQQVRGYMRGGYAKGGAANADRMVKNPKKAMGVALRAIALSEAFDAGTKSKAPVKKAMGGMMHGGMMHGGMMRDGYAKGGAAKAAPKSLSVMIAVGSGKAPPFTKKDQSPVAAVPVGSKKVGKVMSEFSKGDLHSGSSKGPLVKSPKQAMAIALNEARGAKAPVKKAGGGLMSAPGAGAVSDKDMQALKKVAMPIFKKVVAARGAAAAPAGALGAAAGPSRARFDAMMAKRAAMDAARDRPASAMTPAERARITGGEGINPMTGARFGRPYKKGGSTNC